MSFIATLDQRIAKLKETRGLDPDLVAWHAAMHFWTVGEWPTPEEMWQRISSKPMFASDAITLEEARQACIEACDSGTCYGIPTVTALALGELLVDPFVSDLDASPFRIAVYDEMMQELGRSPHFQRALIRNWRWSAQGGEKES